jgi:hypothetical protein
VFVNRQCFFNKKNFQQKIKDKFGVFREGNLAAIPEELRELGRECLPNPLARSLDR